MKNVIRRNIEKWNRQKKSLQCSKLLLRETTRCTLSNKVKFSNCRSTKIWSLNLFARLNRKIYQPKSLKMNLLSFLRHVQTQFIQKEETDYFHQATNRQPPFCRRLLKYWVSCNWTVNKAGSQEVTKCPYWYVSVIKPVLLQNHQLHLFESCNRHLFYLYEV